MFDKIECIIKAKNNNSDDKDAKFMISELIKMIIYL